MQEEKLTLSGALNRSYELARYSPDGRLWSTGWFKVLALFLIGYVVATVVGFLIQAPFLVLQQFLMIRDAVDASDPADLASMTSAMMWTQIPMQLLNSLVQVAVMIYVAFGVSLLYSDLRERREGGDLDAELDVLEGLAAPEAG